MLARHVPVGEPGIPEERIRRLDDYHGGDFSEREKLALEFAEVFSTSPDAATDEFFDRLKTVFMEKEIIELAFVMIGYNGLHRYNTMINADPLRPDGLAYVPKKL